MDSIPFSIDVVCSACVSEVIFIKDQKALDPFLAGIHLRFRWRCWRRTSCARVGLGGIFFQCSRQHLSSLLLPVCSLDSACNFTAI